VNMDDPGGTIDLERLEMAAGAGNDFGNWGLADCLNYNYDDYQQDPDPAAGLYVLDRGSTRTGNGPLPFVGGGFQEDSHLSMILV
jgi:hypothetical protein